MGILRLFLALSVVAGHTSSRVLGIPTIDASAAVSLFFLISGYYMSMVINTKYLKVPVKIFYLSRMLRLFPMYFVGLLIMLCVNFHEVQKFFSDLGIISKLFYLISNLFVFGQDLPYTFCFDTQSQQCAMPVGMTINPPAWSLAVELGFYVVAPFIVRKSRNLILYIFIGLIYSICLRFITTPILNDFLNITNLNILNHYFFPSSFVFFGMGALAYRLNRKLTRLKPIIFLCGLILLSQSSLSISFWIPIFVAAGLPVIFDYSKENRVDRLLGELSYPVYILHFPVIIFVSKYLNIESTGILSQYTSGTIVSIITVVLSLVCVRIVEKPISAIRTSMLKNSVIK